MPPKRDIRSSIGYRGIIIGLSIILIWASSLVYLLSRDVNQLSTIFIGVGILFQTFMYTGLFITTHDAMHGTVFPKKKSLNNFIGRLAVFLYALFSYSKLKEEHWKHHRNPASETDPDFHDSGHPQLWRWYVRFMLHYVSVGQLVGMAIVFNGLLYLIHIPAANLILFWVAPALLSTVQLFYFGTYLPHKRPLGGYKDKHRTESNSLPVFLSFITCYHFGYHWEHHDKPGVPWWQLPRVHKQVQAKMATR